MTTPFRDCLAFVFCVASLVCAHAGAAAQPQPVSAPASPLYEDGLIKLDVAVTDASGKPIASLQPHDFALLDNGQPRPILSFQAFNATSAKPDPPVDVILLIDTINMPISLAAHEWAEVETFLRQNGGRLDHPVSIFQLSNVGLWSVAESSGDGNNVAAEIAHGKRNRLIRRSMGEELPEVSAFKAIGAIAANERPKPGRKIVVWVGLAAGGGNGRANQQDLFNMIVWFSTLLRESRVTLYSIAAEQTNSPAFPYQNYLTGAASAQQATLPDLSVDVLAAQSGGRVLNPANNLAAQIDDCLADATAFYALSFDPRNADHPDEYHDLKVQIDKPGLAARTTTGYYDQPYYSDQPDPALRRVTVAQLQQILQAARGESDAETARQLSALELTERLSTAQLSSWTAGLRGKKARQALVALADASAFLDPPPAEIPAVASPDLAAQRRMLSQTIDSLKKTIPMLPDFFATRMTVHYEETPAQYEQAGKAGIGYQPLHIAGRSTATVLVRNGREVVDAASKHKKSDKEAYLTVRGTFGPILATVLLDATAVHGSLVWSHWEQGANGPQAVFRYAAPAQESHYQVSHCCLPDGDGTRVFQEMAGYHGEITIDPTTGAILRLTMQADLKPSLPLALSDTMVEYGPVEIGGKTYLCPVKSVSISRGRTVRLMQQWDESFRTAGPYVTVLNDVAFGAYHMFRAEPRVLPGFTPTSGFASAPEK